MIKFERELPVVINYPIDTHGSNFPYSEGFLDYLKKNKQLNGIMLRNNLDGSLLIGFENDAGWRDYSFSQEESNYYLSLNIKTFQNVEKKELRLVIINKMKEI